MSKKPLKALIKDQENCAHHFYTWSCRSVCQKCGKIVSHNSPYTRARRKTKQKINYCKRYHSKDFDKQNKNDLPYNTQKWLNHDKERF
jgi:hypothetical protein